MSRIYGEDAMKSLPRTEQGDPMWREALRPQWDIDAYTLHGPKRVRRRVRRYLRRARQRQAALHKLLNAGTWVALT